MAIRSLNGVGIHVVDDPARLAAGQSASPEKVAEVEAFLGLNEPVYVQYYRFLKRLVLEGSLGHSFVDRSEVNDEIFRAAPITAGRSVGRPETLSTIPSCERCCARSRFQISSSSVSARASPSPAARIRSAADSA